MEKGCICYLGNDTSISICPWLLGHQNILRGGKKKREFEDHVSREAILGLCSLQKAQKNLISLHMNKGSSLQSNEGSRVSSPCPGTHTGGMPI